MPMKLIRALGSTLCSAALFAPLTPLAAAGLYVGANCSGVTTDFTSGTNAYDHTFVGFGAGANASTLIV